MNDRQMLHFLVGILIGVALVTFMFWGQDAKIRAVCTDYAVATDTVPVVVAHPICRRVLLKRIP